MFLCMLFITLCMYFVLFSLNHDPASFLSCIMLFLSALSPVLIVLLEKHVENVVGSAPYPR